MVVVPLAASGNSPEAPAAGRGNAECSYWLHVVSAGVLGASGVLLMANKRRVALALAATGTVLAAIDQREIVSDLWSRLPAYLEDVQAILTRAQGTVDELSAQGERLRNIFSR